MTPGPGEYEHTDANRSSTKNHGLKFGWQSNDSRLGSKTFQSHRTSDNTQTMLNSSQFGKFYQSPRDGMFSRKPGHYPQEPANFSLLTQELPLQQPPMCTGKCLNLPDSLPPFKAPTKKFADVESQYSIRNLNKTQRTENDQPADSGFSTIQDSKVNDGSVTDDYRTNKSAMTEKNKKKKFDFSAFKGQNEAPVLKTDNDLAQNSKRSRQSSSVDITHRVAKDMNLNLKKKLSLHSTKHMLAGPKHEFFFEHSHFI